ncbi:hypothetical protein HDU98_003842 [Podochytrium sp. JEL0797]|nr:hypothetical protein HDU98_003842 [Podochytrium sp. JEL0797]
MNIFFGTEPAPIQLHSSHSAQPFNELFTYRNRNTLQGGLPLGDPSQSFYEGCQCEGDCSKGIIECECIREHGAAYLRYQTGCLDSTMPEEMPIFECNRNCSCSATCFNRVVGRGITLSFALVDTPGKGLGLVAGEFLREGQFAMEYAGEVIRADEAQRRWKHQQQENLMNFIICVKEHTDSKTLRTNIDPSQFGNAARFINHSCSPNLAFRTARINSIVPSAALFALHDIPAGEELTFDYGDFVIEAEEGRALEMELVADAAQQRQFIEDAMDELWQEVDAGVSELARRIVQKKHSPFRAKAGVDAFVQQGVQQGARKAGHGCHIRILARKHWRDRLDMPDTQTQRRQVREQFVVGNGGRDTKVAVIGAGMAGIATAISLQRQGFDVSMYDKTVVQANAVGNPTLTFGEVGGGLQVFANGLRALRNLGLGEAIRKAHFDTEIREMNFLLLDGSDRITRNQTSQKAGKDQITCLRSSLHALLMKAASDLGVKTFVGKTLTSLVESSDSVTLGFADATFITTDLVVGADGIHSMTRQLLFPEVPKPVLWITGYIGVLDRQEVGFDYGEALYSNPITGQIAYGCDCGTSSFFQVHASFESRKPKRASTATDAPSSSPFSSVNGYEDWSPCPDLPKEAHDLAALVDSWGVPPSMGACIRRARQIRHVNVYNWGDLSTFHKGRVILVGDAAHGSIPMFGQGVNQAFEDAAVLGDLLGHFEGPEGYKKAFEVNEVIRKPRVQKCTSIARDFGRRMEARTKVGMRAGRIMLRLMIWLYEVFQLNDSVVGHDYREDVVKAVPDIKFI